MLYRNLTRITQTLLTLTLTPAYPIIRTLPLCSGRAMRAATLLREIAAFKAEEYSFSYHSPTTNDQNSQSNHQSTHQSNRQSNHPNGTNRPA